ncbi:MAG: Hsp20/alpha crystallin family protein, partial [Rhodospirillales bacterium]
EVTFADGLLTIQGEHKAETEEKDEDKQYYVRECSYGTFRRVLSVGDRVDEGKIKATFKNGKLKVVLPKTKEAKDKVRKIPISR